MRIARDIVGMVTIAFIFYILSSFVEERAVLARMVIPVAGVRIDQWLSNFRMLSSMGIAISFFASLIWYVTAVRSFDILLQVKLLYFKIL